MIALGTGLGISYAQKAGASFVGPLDAAMTNLYDIYSVSAKLVTSFIGPICRIRDTTTALEYDLTPGVTGLVTQLQVTALVGAHEWTFSKIYGQITGVVLASPAANQPYGAFDANGIMYAYSKAAFTSNVYNVSQSFGLNAWSGFSVQKSTGYQMITLNLIDSGAAESSLNDYSNQLGFWGKPGTMTSISGTSSSVQAMVGNISSAARLTNGATVATNANASVARTITSIRIANGGGAAWWPANSQFYASGFWIADIGATLADTVVANLKSFFHVS